VKLPRDIAGQRLAQAPKAVDYEHIGQRGSHIHMVNPYHGRHRVAIPAHRALKAGTLHQLLKQVAEHIGVTRDELINKLDL
jgi:predicted RNA binding protein YcfA (HicA-like mRNA interferase family)